MKLSYEQTLKLGIKTFARQGFTNSNTLKRSLVFFASSAVGAFFRIKQYLLGYTLTFGIVTPGATQITSLEKYGGANSRSIVD